MKKLYYHPSGIITNEGKVICSVCGVELVDGMSPEPCKIPTAAQSVLNGVRFEISVWNCCPTLLAFEEQNSKKKYYWVNISEELKEKVWHLLIKSIEEAGGAINFLGIYPLNEKLEQVVEEGIKEGKIQLVSESKY
ncbi:hypothetical protein [Thermodesulfovibrio yellowstonii]|uniref:hypothetical protein n=1 Tax=Thermodesulfovibrio yellowstonii TaxID=28262 RepID=UPI0003FB1F9F|nr:hypothetical protein [Thermodesulfovibrio islandicus]